MHARLWSCRLSDEPGNGFNFPSLFAETFVYLAARSLALIGEKGIYIYIIYTFKYIYARAKPCLAPPRAPFVASTLSCCFLSFRPRGGYRKPSGRCTGSRGAIALWLSPRRTRVEEKAVAAPGHMCPP